MNLTVTSAPARIHEWCGRLDDPARDLPCPCRANRSTRLKVELRHRDAVKRAQASAPAEPAERGAA